MLWVDFTIAQNFCWKKIYISRFKALSGLIQSVNICQSYHLGDTQKEEEWNGECKKLFARWRGIFFIVLFILFLSMYVYLSMFFHEL